MSGSTRAPTSAQGSPPELAEASTEAVRDDAYVERLADRLTGSHAPPATAPPPPMPAAAARPQLGARRVPSARPPAPSVPPPPAPPALETSDVRAMPPIDRDDLADPPPGPPSRPPEAFSEFEQDDAELAAESTYVEDRDALASESTQILKELPAMPMLFVEAGRDKGREYVLVEGETTVGRGIDNEVILADVSVSRRHLRVLRDGTSLTLRDMGSGNGTLVNGRRVHSVALSDGDRIELGETLLVVRVPGAELEAADPAAMRPQYGAGVIAGGAHGGMGSPDTTDETAVPMSGPSFEQSLPGGGSAWSIPPPASSLPPPTPSATSWLPGAGGDRTSSIVLDRRTLLIAAAAIAIGASVLGALVVAVMVRQPAAEPVASTLPLEPGAPIAVPALPPTPATAAGPATLPAVPPSAVPTAPVPAPVAPPAPAPAEQAAAEREAAERAAAERAAAERAAAEQAAAERAAGARAAADRDRAAAAERRSSDRAAPRERAARPVRAPTRTRTAGAGGADAYLGAYRSGDFAGASRQARAGGQAARALQIDQFATHYANAQRAAAGSPASITALERAIAIDNQIVRGGHYGTRLRGQLVASYLTAAQSSIGARPQEACRRVQLALRLDRSSSRGQGMARQCETQAQRLLGEAAGVERSDPQRARALYQSVLPMVPSTSATYTRARQRVDAMARSRPVDEDE